MRRILPLIALLLGIACDGSDPVAPGPPTGPTIPSIGGTYTSAPMWRFEQVRSTGGPVVLNCAGGLTIASQLAETFSGTFFVNDPTTCGVATGSVTSGTLRADGTVTFALTSADGTNFLTAAFGCTYISGDTLLTGTVTGNTLQAQSSTRMNCPQSGGELTLNVSMSGTK